MFKTKKLLLSFGTVAAVVGSTATVIACGADSGKTVDKNKETNIDEHEEINYKNSLSLPKAFAEIEIEQGDSSGIIKYGDIHVLLGKSIISLSESLDSHVWDSLPNHTSIDATIKRDGDHINIKYKDANIQLSDSKESLWTYVLNNHLPQASQEMNDDTNTGATDTGATGISQGERPTAVGHHSWDKSPSMEPTEVVTLHTAVSTGTGHPTAAGHHVWEEHPSMTDPKVLVKRDGDAITVKYGESNIEMLGSSVRGLSGTVKAPSSPISHIWDGVPDHSSFKAKIRRDGRTLTIEY